MAHTGVTEADQPYWDNLRAGRLTMQKCEACNNWQWPAVFRCTECGAWDPPWQDVKMEGTVFSWIRTFQNFGLDYLPPPFVSVLVALDGADGNRLMGTLEVDNEDVAIGKKVTGKIITRTIGDRPLPTIVWTVQS